MANTLGNLFRLTTFGESHGPAIGGIIDGCPAGIKLDLTAIQHELNRRKPGQSKIVTQRKEPDEVVFLSGIFEGETTGTPIGFQIVNTNQKSKDYSDIKNTFRPSHADYTYTKKYGTRDYRGGGRSSARETANWIVAGSIAKQVLTNVEITAYTSSVGPIHLNLPYDELDFSTIENNMVRCPDGKKADEMIDLIQRTKKNGDTVGGIISCVIKNTPIGLGAPVFNKLHADLGHAMLSLNAVKGFEFGSGFEGSEMNGSTHNDQFKTDGTTKTNYSGGIQGGISNGMDIYFRVAFKPVATLLQKYETINDQNEKVSVQGKGRHDPCVVPRAVPIIEALSAMVILDHILLHNSYSKKKY